MYTRKKDTKVTKEDIIHLPGSKQDIELSLGSFWCTSFSPIYIFDINIIEKQGVCCTWKNGHAFNRRKRNRHTEERYLLFYVIGLSWVQERGYLVVDVLIECPGIIGNRNFAFDSLWRDLQRSAPLLMFLSLILRKRRSSDCMVVLVYERDKLRICTW